MIMGRTLRSQITFQSVTTSKDAYGGVTETWTDYATRYAEIRPMGGREYYQAQQVASDNKWGFKVRYDSLTKNITSKHRIVYGSKIMDIQGEPVNTDERNKEIVIIGLERNG